VWSGRWFIVQPRRWRRKRALIDRHRSLNNTGVSRVYNGFGPQRGSVPSRRDLRTAFGVEKCNIKTSMDQPISRPGEQASSLSVGGIVLCGGRSSRMGHSKALLPFGPERLLTRTVRLLGEVVAPIVVVAAADQELGDLPHGVIVARDREPHLGPLSGILGGLTALDGRVPAAYVTGCDTPFLSPSLVRHLIGLLGDHEAVAAVEHVNGRALPHPLSAVYRLGVRPHVEQLLSAGRLRASELLEQVDALLVAVKELQPIDPGLRSLRNLNYPEDYRQALQEAGFSPPADLR
jgi:molybdenum cofactor guanylyltransferase